MSLKCRRGSHNLYFGGQTVPGMGGAATANALSPIFRYSPPNDQVAAAWWSQRWPWRIACRRCQQFGNVTAGPWPTNDLCTRRQSL